jgi:tetratricopeptide (TPR) repeat protein
MRELRQRLPDTMPLSGLAIGAVADRVVVREGGSRWAVESGQYLLEFEGDPATGALSVIERQADEPTAHDWLAKAVALEERDRRAAGEAYERAIAADTSLVDAHINYGRMLHDGGELARAERVYRAGIEACGNDPVLLFNLAVLLEDLRRGREAMAAYEAALTRDPDFADCHYNLALLCEAQGKPKDAIRHMARYRVLSRR